MQKVAVSQKALIIDIGHDEELVRNFVAAKLNRIAAREETEYIWFLFTRCDC